MGHPAEKRHRATYDDLEAVPPGKVAELIDGELYVHPRPAPPHLNVEWGMAELLRGPFQRGRGGPGGWVILPEPEVHFPDPAAPKGVQVVAPDVAGWRRERMPKVPVKPAHIALAPDWACEILSPSTEEYDRRTKMPLYASNGVRWAWLVDPLLRSLEVYVLQGGRWREPTVHRGAARVRAAPFGEIELDLSILWEE